MNLNLWEEMLFTNFLCFKKNVHEFCINNDDLNFNKNAHCILWMHLKE